MAKNFSARLNNIIPHDHLEMMLPGGNTFTHLVELGGGVRFPVGEVTYKRNPEAVGKVDETIEKVEFLYDVAEMIKKGILYA